MDFRVVLEPGGIKSLSVRQNIYQATYHVEIQLVLEQSQTSDDIFVIDTTQQHNFCGQLSICLVFHPSMVGHLRLYNKLDRDFLSFDTVQSCHDETVTSTTKLVLKLISFNEIGVKQMSFGKLGRKCGRIGDVVGVGFFTFGGLFKEFMEIAKKRRNARIAGEVGVVLLFLFQAHLPSGIHTSGARRAF